MSRYILDGHTPVQCEDIESWARWFDTADTHVAQDEVKGFRISTVFLAIDHNFTSDGPPLLFETMVFAGSDRTGEDQWRCSAWDEAVAQHEKAVATVRSQVARARGGA